tara:strand:+ start:277 stop:1122 length:846 start_codon:yes stop_codon:yes gene_type:complete
MAKNIVIITDLDGTLLNFKNFEYKSILPFINTLTTKGVEIILCSSKCYMEITQINNGLNLISPFIVENGSAIYYPKKTFTKRPPNSTERENYWEIVLGTPRDELSKKIRSNTFKKYLRYILFLKNMTKLQQAYYTGLKSDALDVALERRFSEPLIWMGTNKELDSFKKDLNEESMDLNAGARLLHLTGLNTKGDALKELIQSLHILNYFNNSDEIVTIACGDSENDISMMEIANYAVVIRLPDKKNINLKRTTNVFNSKNVAPKGWKETLEEIDIIKEIIR